jgi:hypothetical protein
VLGNTGRHSNLTRTFVGNALKVTNIVAPSINWKACTTPTVKAIPVPLALAFALMVRVVPEIDVTKAPPGTPTPDIVCPTTKPVVLLNAVTLLLPVVVFPVIALDALKSALMV